MVCVCVCVCVCVRVCGDDAEHEDKMHNLARYQWRAIPLRVHLRALVCSNCAYCCCCVAGGRFHTDESMASSEQMIIDEQNR